MIVPTMSYPEIYYVLENAVPKIRYKMEQLRPKAVKYFTREVWKYPAWKTYDYTIPVTNDTYVIFFYAADAGAADKPLAGSFCYLRHWNPWQVMLVPEMAGELLLPPLKLKLFFAYTSHFFDRYRERYLKTPSLSILETICRFFSRNGLMFNLCEADNRLWPAMKDEDTNERIDGRCALQIVDGLELARAWEAQKPDAAEGELPEMIIFKALTFIPREMYFSDQSDSSAEHVVELGKSYLRSLDKRPVDPKNFAEIMRRNELRMRVEDLESTL